LRANVPVPCVDTEGNIAVSHRNSKGVRFQPDRDESIERVFNVCLNEFPDPTDYALTGNDTADCLRSIEKL
jgi:hypothetical protein